MKKNTAPKESRHVELAREFEALKERLSENDANLEQAQVAEQDATEVYERIMKEYQTLRQSRHADRRVILAQLESVRELLAREL